jgi:DNA-binding response OmpR family regulator
MSIDATPAPTNGRPVSQVPRVLIAHANVTAHTQLREQLRRAGVDCTVATDPSTILKIVTDKYFDVVVLDADPAGVAVLDLCLAIRRAPLNRHVALVVCSTFNSGSEATDLDLRIPRSRQIDDIATAVRTALTDRAPRAIDSWLPPVRIHDIEIDPDRLTLRVRGQRVPVTRLECRLLYLLAAHPGMVFSRRRLLDRLWPPDTHVTMRSVDALVGRLRRKIEDDPRSPRILLTAWGEGYCVAEAAASVNPGDA